MTVTVATFPQYPAAGGDTRVDFTVAGTGNLLKGFFTDAPLGSEIKTELLNTGASRLAAFVVDSNKSWSFKPELGGVYTLQVEQYQKGASAYGGGYQDSPDGHPLEELIATSTTTISVGQKITQRVGYGSDTATLTFFVSGNYVRPTTFEQYGFTSPLISDAKTPKATTAMLNAGIVAAVTALAGQTATTLLGDARASFNDLVNQLAGHTGNLASHASGDAANRPGDGYFNPTTSEGFKRCVARLLVVLGQHMRNDGVESTPPGGTGTDNFHLVGVPRVDWNTPLTVSIGDDLDAFVGLADAFRVYNAHRIDTVVHAIADTTNVPSALPPLLNVHALFLTQLTAQSPTAPPSVNPGVTALVHGAGFEEA